MKKSKAKGKGKPRYRDIQLDYHCVDIPGTSTSIFKFREGLEMLVISIPTIGVVVVGRSPASRAWTYPPGTPVKDAMSKTFRLILEQACEESKKAKA